MSTLDPRKLRILEAVVQDYVNTTRPVGSERIIEVYNPGCKSATVRNELAELVDLGYLIQPHTSAGRIPTDLGYRYFVDQLMQPPGALSPEDEKLARTSLKGSVNEIEAILQITCKTLSALTSYASIATAPVTDSIRLRRLYLTHASPRHILAVALFSTGAVEHRLIEVESAPADSTLVLVANVINEQAADQNLEDVERLLRVLEMPSSLLHLAAVKGRVVTAITQLITSIVDRRVYFQGAYQLMRQPEFQDVQRLENLLTALEKRSALFKVLRRSLAGYDVTIHIGSENPYEPMQTCTLITRPYRIGDRHAGFIAVLGPTRMHYQRTISAVNFMSASLSNMLTSMCVA